MSGVGSPAFLPPANFVRSPEAMDRDWSPEEGRAYTRRVLVVVAGREVALLACGVQCIHPLVPQVTERHNHLIAIQKETCASWSRSLCRLGLHLFDGTDLDGGIGGDGEAAERSQRG